MFDFLKMLLVCRLRSWLYSTLNAKVGLNAYYTSGVSNNLYKFASKAGFQTGGKEKVRFSTKLCLYWSYNS